MLTRAFDCVWCNSVPRVSPRANAIPAQVRGSDRESRSPRWPHLDPARPAQRPAPDRLPSTPPQVPPTAIHPWEPIDEASSLSLVPMSGVPVRIGFDDFEPKLARLERIYAEIESRLPVTQYIDLNAVDRVIVKLDPIVTQSKQEKS